MTLPRGRSKTELQRLYGKSKKFGNFNLHHMVPSTREGETNEFNLFPYGIKRHSAYHEIFLNMTIWEVYEALEDIYDKIFNSNKERINRGWLVVCKLKNEYQLKIQMEKVYGVEYLQEKWFIAFGGYDIKQAQKFIKHMMLFIIFGSRVVDTEKLFNNGHLAEFFEKYPADEDRLRAFDICFGEFADWPRIKTNMSKILR